MRCGQCGGSGGGFDPDTGKLLLNSCTVCRGLGRIEEPEERAIRLKIEEKARLEKQKLKVSLMEAKEIWRMEIAKVALTVTEERRVDAAFFKINGFIPNSDVMHCLAEKRVDWSPHQGENFKLLNYARSDVIRQAREMAGTLAVMNKLGWFKPS